MEKRLYSETLVQTKSKLTPRLSWDADLCGAHLEILSPPEMRRVPGRCLLMNERRREGHMQGASRTAAGPRGEAARHQSGKGPGRAAPSSVAREGLDAGATAGREKGRAAVTGEGAAMEGVAREAQGEPCRRRERHPPLVGDAKPRVPVGTHICAERWRTGSRRR